MILEKKHRSIVQGENHLKQLRDGPPRWETAVADFLVTFENWLRFEIFDNAKWNQRPQVEKFLMKCASEVWEPRKKGRCGNKKPVTDLRELAGKMAIGNLPGLPSSAFMVVTRTTNLKVIVLLRLSACWMAIWFVDQPMTVFQATSIPCQACPERIFLCTRFGPYGSLWGGGFGILICKEHWWQIKWVLARLSPQWQQKWYANC